MYKIIGSPGCGVCVQAKNFLDAKNEEYEYEMLEEISAQQQQKLMQIAGVIFRTVPQIFKETEDGLSYVGGFKQLKETFDAA